MDKQQQGGIAVRILVVEANKISQQAQKMMLDRLGNYQVDLAEDGKSAFQLIQRHAYDIILMDIYLPDMHGIEAIKFLRCHNEMAKIIVAATYISEEVEKNCLNAGGNILLKKPIMMEVLRYILKKQQIEAEMQLS
jgi:CheY-like chemotaxis protein